MTLLRDWCIVISSSTFLITLGILLLSGLHEYLTILHEKRHMLMIRHLAPKQYVRYPTLTGIDTTPTFSSKRVLKYRIVRLYTGHTDSQYYTHLAQHKDDKICLHHISLIAFVGTPLENIGYGLLTVGFLILIVTGIFSAWTAVILVLLSIGIGVTATLFMLSLIEITGQETNYWNYFLHPETFMYKEKELDSH